MRYDLSNPFQAAQARKRFAKFLDDKTVIELTEKRVRTLSQNAYLHVCIGCVALELGETIEYVKQYYFKRACNADIFTSTKFDKVLGYEVDTIRSSSDLTKEEMSIAIDRFIAWSAEHGIYIPSPDEKEILFALEGEIERNKRYLRND